MSFLNSMKKTFGLGSHNDATWWIAKEVYGEDITDELRDLGGTPTALMTNYETKAYNVLSAIYKIEEFEFRTIPSRMTDERRARLEERRISKEKAKDILECGNFEKWSERLDRYRSGERVFDQPPRQQQVNSADIEVDTEPLAGETKYEALARIIFDVCLNFTNNIGEFMANDSNADRYSMEVIMAATTFGTAMYKYSVRLACDRLSHLLLDQNEYKKEYPVLLREFADKIQEPQDSFIESIEHFDKKETVEILENVASNTAQSLEGYLSVIEDSIDKLIGREPDGIQGLSYQQSVMATLGKLDRDFWRNPWENNQWIALTRSICGDKMAKELMHVGGLDGHGSILQICTREESEAGKVLIEASINPSSHNADDIKKAHSLLYDHDKDFWEKRLMLKKAGLDETYYYANESEEENRRRWKDYEKIYGKTVSSKIRAINKFCPSWLADKVAKEETMSWIDIQRQKPTFWRLAFEKYSSELIEIMKECEDCC